MIDNKTYVWLYFFVGITYLTGLFIAPLMENDAIEYATVAMRMFQDGDYANIINRFDDYLDKPHLLFWLSGFSFSIFSISDWAYRLPSVLVSFLGAYATYRLGYLLYSKDIGKLSALIFLTTQATILGNHDVRTDALLTGTVIIGIWQLAEFIDNNKLKHVIFGGMAIALGFSTKGQIAVLTAGIAILCHVIYLRKWDTFWNWKWLVGLLAFFLAASPMLYCYYVQFDLHPEKLVHGQHNVSGVKFIFWGQSFERLVGDRSFVDNPDYFFLHHSFLWAFLPWTAMAIGAIFHQIKSLVISKFKYQRKLEFLTLGGTLIVFSIISFSSFKLPHYINVLFPLFSILTAHYIIKLFESNQIRILKFYLIILYIMAPVFLILLVFLNLWAFPMDQWAWITAYIVFLVYLISVLVRKEELFKKLVIGSVVLISFTNFILHTNFYPKLIKYQSGSELAYAVHEQNIPIENIYFLDTFSRSFDFYTESFIREISIEQLASENIDREIWVFTYEEGIEKLRNAGIVWEKEIKAEHFRITNFNAQFLNPETRSESLTNAYILKIR
jgi:4-amino-4-deoxy-L-arabinose transferase-like glycosyltransferase